MSKTPDLAESLAWLDHCLGETEAAMAAVKGGLVQTERLHEFVEMAATITTMRGRCARLRRAVAVEERPHDLVQL